MQDEHFVRLFEDLTNQFVRECLFLLAEFVGGGITPNEVLKNIFNTFGVFESMKKLSSYENEP